MEYNLNYKDAREMLLQYGWSMETEKVALEEAEGRILAAAVTASENVPAFDRSPYDGYALRAEDTKSADREHPVTLAILEEVPAGAVPSKEVHAGEAVKILTGAPIPLGADCVIMYEKTEFSDTAVTVFSPLKSGDNIVRTGEDVKQGQVLAEKGMRIDPGLAGTLAGQGIYWPEVYRKPLAGIISTGSELIDPGDEIVRAKSSADVSQNVTTEKIQDPLPAGKIRNTNRYTLAAALQKDGCNTKYLGTAGDDANEIAALIRRGLEEAGCDILFLTGGVSAGDYDLTPDAMEMAGCSLLLKGVKMKPGMACCYGMRDGKLVCGLSGNPSSSILNYYAVARPSVRKLAGMQPVIPRKFSVTLAEGFAKKSPQDRFLKGIVTAEGGKAIFRAPKGQGNTMIGSFIGCNALAVIPGGSGPIEAGTVLQAFFI